MKKKSLSKLKKKLWEVFALYIKLKYSEDGKTCRCFTSGVVLTIGTSNCQAGHYYSKKGYPALYFDEDNVRPQSYHDNINLSGNTQIFRENLIAEIGAEAVERLDQRRHNSVKLTCSDYEEKIEYYSQKIKELR